MDRVQTIKGSLKLGMLWLVIMCQVCKVKRHTWCNPVWVSLILWLRLQSLCWNCLSILGNLRAGAERREQLSGSHQASVVTMSTMNDVHQFRSKTPSFLISAEPPAQVWSLDKYLRPCHVVLDYISLMINCTYLHFASGVAHLSAEQVGSGGGNLLLQEPCWGQDHHIFGSDLIMDKAYSVFRWRCCSRRTSTWTSWGGRRTRRGSMCRRRYRTWW